MAWKVKTLDRLEKNAALVPRSASRSSYSLAKKAEIVTACTAIPSTRRVVIGECSRGGIEILYNLLKNSIKGRLTR